MSEKLPTNVENQQSPEDITKATGPETLEPELSPEVLEKVMGKVQDINTKGTGVHSIATRQQKEGLPVLKDMFTDGLLGHPFAHPDKKITKEEWVKKARNRDQLLLFFNIIGRDIDRVEDSGWTGERASPPVWVIFDTSSFKEDSLVANYAPYPDSPFKKELQYKTKTFGANRPEYERQIDKLRLKEEYTRAPHRQEGYALTFRVAPRFFRGIIFKLRKKASEEDIEMIVREERRQVLEAREQRIKSGYPLPADRWPDNWSFKKEMDFARFRYEYIEDTDPENQHKRVQEILLLMLETCERKKKNLVPIYDSHGNLYWPQKMSYEEVKKFVAERDSRKK